MVLLEGSSSPILLQSERTVSIGKWEKSHFLDLGKKKRQPGQEGTAHGVGFSVEASYVLAGSKLFAQSSL